MSTLLNLQGFGLAFGQRAILREVSFELPAQGCTVLLGPAGTGKSTLLRTLAGLLAGHSQVRLWGDVIYRGKPWRMDGDRPVLVEQKPQLLVASVWDNLVMELPDRAKLTRAQQSERVSQNLAQLGQEHLMQQLKLPVIDLPVEQQRIVAILRKAMAGPDLLMVDEPTAHLRDAAAAPINRLLKQLSRQTPLLVVSHHQGQTREIADQVILIANGVVQEDQPVESFFNNPRNELTRHFLRSGSCPETGPGPLEEVLAETGKAPQVIELPVKPAPETQLPLPSSLENYPPAAHGPRGFVWLYGGLVAGTPQPGIGLARNVEGDLQALDAVGIRHLVTLTEAPFRSSLLAKYGIDTSFHPIPDMHAPSLSQAIEVCRAIDLMCHRGKSVAVHCKAGLGRTGTILAAYWIWRHQGRIKGEEAVSHIRRLEPKMIQSQEQEDFLSRFAVELRTMSLSFQDQADPVAAA